MYAYIYVCVCVCHRPRGWVDLRRTTLIRLPGLLPMPHGRSDPADGYRGAEGCRDSLGAAGAPPGTVIARYVYYT